MIMMIIIVIFDATLVLLQLGLQLDHAGDDDNDYDDVHHPGLL